MNSKSRTKNSIVNSVSAILSRGMTTLLQFVLRTVLIQFFVKEYLGVNGLFTNILTVLSLAELGVGDAIVFSMYKPLAENDNRKLHALMHLYAKAYRFIALAVAVIGGALVPFLDFLVKKKPTDPFLLKYFVPIYLLFVLNTVVSYLFAYKRSIIIADQKLYIANNYTVIFNIIKSGCQIVAIIFRQYIIYLVLQVFFTLITNLAISKKANRMYPFISGNAYSGEKLNKSEKEVIFGNIKALIFYKIGSVSLDFSDNIIISAIFGLASVANLDNYMLITNSVQTVLFQISNSVSASIGNVVATESKEKQYSIFKVVDLINVMLYGFCSVCIFVLINPFITLWIGSGWTFPLFTVAIIAVNLYILGSMNAVWSYRSTMGLFVHGRFRPLISAIVNIIISIILGKFMMEYRGLAGGVTGVLIGTTITRLTTNVWFDPYIVFKHGFKSSVLPYYLNYLKNFVIIAITATITYLTVSILPNSGILWFIVKTILTAIISGIMLILFYCRSAEFKYIICQFKRMRANRKSAKKA